MKLATFILTCLVTASLPIASQAQMGPGMMPEGQMDPETREQMMQRRQWMMQRRQQMMEQGGGMGMMHGGPGMMHRGPGMKNPEMMQQMRERHMAHMRSMEQRLERIESLLQQLVDQQQKN